MLLAAEEVSRSLRGSWELLNRRPRGLQQFDCSLTGFCNSFAAVLVAAPPFVAALAAERTQRGLAAPGLSLFSDTLVVIETALAFFLAWVSLPAVAWALTKLLRIERRLVPFVVATNWSNVLASFFFGVPAALYALDLATSELAAFYGFAFAVIVAQMRWFIAKTALGVSSGVAALLVVTDFGLESLVNHALHASVWAA